MNKKTNIYKVTHEGLDCIFCGKHFGSLNALTQHELRCKENPNRKSYNNLANYIVENRKGKNKYNCEDVAKQVATTVDKYSNGYVSPIKGRKIEFDYIYKEHNQKEIDRWLEYINSKDVTIPVYEVASHGQTEDSYNIVSKHQITENTSVKLLFEHDFIANIYLDGALDKSNTVHHIDKNKKNNDIHNLMVFHTQNDHKRFHNSKYARLFYDDVTHTFTCEIYKV